MTLTKRVQQGGRRLITGVLKDVVPGAKIVKLDKTRAPSADRIEVEGIVPKDTDLASAVAALEQTLKAKVIEQVTAGVRIVGAVYVPVRVTLTHQRDQGHYYPKGGVCSCELLIITVRN